MKILQSIWRMPAEAKKIAEMFQNKKRETKTEDKNKGKTKTELVDKLDGGWGWMAVLGAFFVNWFASGLIRSYGAIHVEVLETFDRTTETQASWIPALLTFFAIGLAPVAGALCKVFTCRNVAFVGGLFCSLGLSLSFFATSIVHLCITIGLMTGIGAALSLMSAVIAVNFQFEKKRALAMGCTLSGVAVGSLTLPPIVEALVSAYSFQGALLIMGAGFAHICACALLFTPNGKWFTATEELIIMSMDGCIDHAADRGSRNTNNISIANDKNTIFSPADGEVIKLLPKCDRSKGTTAKNETNKTAKLIMLNRCGTRLLLIINDLSKKKNLLSNDNSKSNNLKSTSPNTLEPRVGKSCNSASPMNGMCWRRSAAFLSIFLNFKWFKELSYTLSIVSSICIAGVYPHTLIYAPAYAMTLGFSKADAGLLLSISAIVDVINRPIYGYLTDLQFLTRPRLLAISCCAISVGTLCLPLVSSYIALAICATIISSGIGTTFTLLPIILADNHGVQSLHSTYGMMRFFQGTFILIMGPVTGAIKDSTGYYDGCFYLMGLIVSGGIFAMLWMPCAQRYDNKKQQSSATYIGAM